MDAVFGEERWVGLLSLLDSDGPQEKGDRVRILTAIDEYAFFRREPYQETPVVIMVVEPLGAVSDRLQLFGRDGPPAETRKRSRPHSPDKKRGCGRETRDDGGVESRVVARRRRGTTPERNPGTEQSAGGRR